VEDKKTVVYVKVKELLNY